MINKYLKPLTKSQGGYASFVITLVTIIVVSLIVIAFATDSRIEQKDSLSNNLATQAYYAAESGINDAYAIVANDLSTGAQITPTNDGCANSSSGYINSNSNYLKGSPSQSTGQVAYTCLIVNPTPNNLTYPDVIPGRGVVIPITTTSTIAAINVTWQEHSPDNPLNNTSFTTCPSSTNSGANLPAASSYSPANALNTNTCEAGVLQLDMISGSDLSSELGSSPFDSLAKTYFLQPINTTSATVHYNNVYYVSCNSNAASGTTFACNQTINVPTSPANDVYYLHLQSFYQPSDVNITALGSGNNPLNVSGAQVLIDATGDASGQLKRLQERICINNYCDNSSTGEGPGAAIQSTQCLFKQFYVPSASSNPQPNSC